LLPRVGAVCFSPEADIVAGVIVTAIGIDTLRHVGHDREAAMAALPVIFGLHQLIEVPVWWALEGRVPLAVGRGAAWLYLAIAFGLIPWAVPYAVRRLEVDPRRRSLMSGFVGLGVIVAIALMIPKEATAPALILIGLNMFSNLRKVDLANFTDALPVLMMVMITLISNSFGTGIAGGLLFYVIIKVVAGKAREVPVGLYILAIPLVYYFATLVHH